MNNTFSFTITLYSQYKDDSEQFPRTKWKRNFLRNCYFGSIMEKKLTGNTLSTSDGFVCRIPQNEVLRVLQGSGKNKFVLSPGDIVVKGKVFDEIKDCAGQRASDLINKYKTKAFVIKSVSDNTLLPYMPHYRVSGGE